MRNALLLSLLLVTPTAILGVAPTGAAQASQPPADPATKKPDPTTQKPRTPARGAQPAPAQARGGMALTVTDPAGATRAGVKVDANGPTMRSGTTNASGQLNFTGMQAGTYRVTFSGEEVTAFEREITVRTGQTSTLDIQLTAAPPPRVIVKEAPPASPAPPAVGPLGEAQVLSLVDLAEKEYERKQPRRETLVACSGNTRSTLLQLNQDQPERLYEDAEALLYVVAGEGMLRLGGKESKLVAGSFASVPRNSSFVVGRRGRNPLILLSVLSGAPCEEAK